MPALMPRDVLFDTALLRYCFDAVLAVGFGRIAFAYSNDLTVCSFEAETELAGLVLVDLELVRHDRLTSQAPGGPRSS